MEGHRRRDGRHPARVDDALLRPAAGGRVRDAVAQRPSGRMEIGDSHPALPRDQMKGGNIWAAYGWLLIDCNSPSRSEVPSGLRDALVPPPPTNLPPTASPGPRRSTAGPAGRSRSAARPATRRAAASPPPPAAAPRTAAPPAGRPRPGRGGLARQGQPRGRRVAGSQTPQAVGEGQQFGPMCGGGGVWVCAAM